MKASRRYPGILGRGRHDGALRVPWRILALGAALAALGAGNALASALVPQTWLPGQCIPQFQVALPTFGPGYNAALPRVDALRHPALTVKMVQTSEQVLPTDLSLYPANAFGTNCAALLVNPALTKVYAYETSDSLTGKVLGPAHWPAVTVETRRFVPTLVTYVNALPNGAGSVQALVSTDPSVFWADPNGAATQNPCLNNPGGPGCSDPYAGPVPAVPHLHGGEVPSIFDGGPDAWFTPTGLKGPGYNSLLKVGAGKAVYLYPNAQEPGTPWFHDHALGATRTNVYSGLAAFYFLRDPSNEPKDLPSDAYEVEMAIQDRQFDTNGQLLFPDGSGDCGTGTASDPCWNGPPPNPGTHALWIPEFVGDVAIVNGTPWPFFNVEARRYRFRIVGGANARMWNLKFGSAPVWVIGMDDAYLDSPARVSTVFIAPGERADIVVDFTNFAGQTITVTNDAPVPFPDGVWPVDHVDPASGAVIPADQPWMASIMQFRVNVALRGADTSCNPAKGGCKRPSKMVRLADGQGSVAKHVKIDQVRQLILKEQEGPGGPLQVLVNNTQFYGLGSPGVASEFPVNGISELPRVGSTELWEIINLTMDGHPMHTHLTQFQIVNRQPFNQDPVLGYPAAWAAAFAGKCSGGPADNPCPGYGPPNSYLTPNGDGALGGNPAVGPFLNVGAARPPEAFESGWKDTAKSYPGEVLRILVRFAPTSTPQALARAGLNWFPFDPTKGPGYVWHCHIVDHEDNEMMRPYTVMR